MAQTAATTSTTVSCNLTEQELWSGLDRQAPEILDHVAHCPACQEKAAGFTQVMDSLAAGSVPPSVPLPERIGVYVVHRRLGEGGMGIVYEGEQQTPKRRVALKVVRGGQFVDEYRLKLFQREVQTLARLKHPAIAAIYESGRTEDGQHYFAMELVGGARLNDYVRAHKIPRRARLELFRKICDAINYAHQRGVIHRDLKPSNIIVEENGNPKILDFGLARINDPDVPTLATATLAGRIMGTLAYMSPEEARGNPDEIDIRSDVYALGVILYELLTDQLPYVVHRAALHEAVRTICEEPPRRPTAIDSTLRGDLETIVLKSLEKERGRRYQSAAALSDDVHRYLTDQPILARRANMLYQLRKFLMRHKFVLIFTLALIGVIIGSSVWVRRSESFMQESFDELRRMQDIVNAQLRAQFADAMLDEDKEKALHLYREALREFERIGRSDLNLVRIKNSIAEVLCEMTPPDFMDARQMALSAVNALAKLESSAGTRQEMVRALETLLLVFGPAGLNETELARDTAAELARVRQEIQAAQLLDGIVEPSPTAK